MKDTQGIQLAVTSAQIGNEPGPDFVQMLPHVVDGISTDSACNIQDVPPGHDHLDIVKIKLHSSTTFI
jgi:hypothetical protein